MNAKQYNFSDWDWGTKSNQKLREIFSIPADQPLQSNEQLDFFLEYLINEIDVCELVSNFLYYAPKEDIQEFAKSIDCFTEEAAQ